MASEWQIKRDICDIGRRLYDRGFVAANDGNISVRIGANRFLCTPTGVSKGFLKPADIAVVDDTGKQLSGNLPRTSEILLHLEIYHELPEINAVIHAHPPHATAFAVAGIPIPQNVLPEVEVFIGQIPLAEYDTPGGVDLPKTILPHLRNKANTILLGNHGAVTCDKTLEKAHFHLETLDMYCDVLLLSKQVGNIRQISEGKVRELLQFKKKLGIDDPRIDSDAASCELSGSDEFLRGFSQRPIPQHTPDANGHGRGNGIAGAPSQAGQPQPVAPPAPSPLEAKALSGLGSSSSTVRDRAAEDEIERLVQLITDQIIGSV